MRASAINLNEGVESPIDKFETWLRGEWQPRTFTDVKPTPVGVAYPALASVTAVVIDRSATPPRCRCRQFKVFRDGARRRRRAGARGEISVSAARAGRRRARLAAARNNSNF